jgi:hypothetical protein
MCQLRGASDDGNENEMRLPRGWATVAAAPLFGVGVGSASGCERCGMSEMRAITLRRDTPGWAAALRVLEDFVRGGDGGGDGRAYTRPLFSST